MTDNSSSNSSNNSIAVAILVVVVVVVIIVVGNRCYNEFLLHVMPCVCSSETWIMRMNVGEKVGWQKIKTVYCWKFGTPKI
jgi:hypothetical protein